MLYRGQNKHKTKNNSSWLFNSFMHFCGTLNWIVRHLFKSIFVEPCHPVQLGAWKQLHPLHHSSYAIAIELYLKPAVNISLAMSLLQVFLGSCPIRQCCNVHVVLDRQYCHHYISTIDVQVMFILLFSCSSTWFWRICCRSFLLTILSGRIFCRKQFYWRKFTACLTFLM